MIIRQGDIFLIKVPEKRIPTNYQAHPTTSCIVGYGEVTGHHHVIEKAQWLVDACHDINSLHRFALDGTSPNDVFVQVTDPTQIVHDEHYPLAIPPGTYQVVRQREYTPRGVRRVRD
ncbi:MAG TPA: hypothetical protein VLL52_03255 [Anaerolineae bacterium]|nr:hypothetical protein [Anaerolineae bacterium]